ncbi:MAG: SMC family ATPase [Acidimicrobiia bacterium]
MRPLELQLRNFRSYFGTQAVFDFRNRSLVGIVGPIGSGKSSLLDGVAFALYGRTPSEGSATSRLIHQRAGDGGVSLRFEVEGEIWEAVRVLRRKGQSQHALYRYDEDTPEAEPVEKVTQERQVNDRIRELLGLDFDTFGRSVLLAQGRFAEFLKGAPADRDRVLKGVFGHDRIDQMREVAKARSVILGREAAALDGRLAQVALLRARLAERVSELDDIEARLEALAKAEPAVVDLELRISAAGAGVERAGARREELAPLGERLAAPSVVAELEERLGALEAGRRRLAVERAEADIARKDADGLLAELDAAGEQEKISAAETALAAHEQASQRLAAGEEASGRVAAQLEQRVAKHDGVTITLAEAALVERSTEVTLAAADQDLARARSARHDAAHRNMATELRKAITAGDACPVCHQPVETPPLPGEAPDLDAAQAVEAAAEGALRAARARRDEAATEVAQLEATTAAVGDEIARLGTDLERAEEAVATATRAVDIAASEVGRLLGEGDASELLEARRRRLGDARAAAVEARRRFEAVDGELRRVVDDVTAVAAGVGELRRDADRVAGRLGVDDDTGGTGAAAFGAYLARVRLAWTTALEQASAEADAAAVELAASTASRAELLAELGVSGDFHQALAAARADVERLARDVATDRLEVAAANALEAERAVTASDKAVYDRIAGDLTNANFIRFLLDDERARLAELGGDHFMRLTSGRYRFTDDGVFDVVDQTAAGTVRKASSLSGGETFLASLALALALAEMVTRTGGRLDAFFIDEGFGSLDPEHLDLAMEGIGSLVAAGSSRLVVVVSHVPEMQETIGDLIRLDRDPLTGDTRVLSA